METIIKILFFFLLVDLITISVNAQSSRIYYNFPDNVEVKLNTRIDSSINLYKKSSSSFRLYLAINKCMDTTQVLISSFDIKKSRFNFILDNTNRFYKAHLKKGVLAIPIVFNTDFSLSESLNFKEMENGKQGITKIQVRSSGYLIGFIIRKNIASIVIDKYSVD